jgi:amino acid transporter
MRRLMDSRWDPARTAREEEKQAQLSRDAEELQRLGYTQELLRAMGGFTNFALSFSIISILTGAVTLYGHGIKHGGPLVMTLGWPLVSLMTLTVALSLAQLASSFPTAGALYHWSAVLGGTGWGYLTAWLNTIGQFAITAGIDYGLAEFACVLLGKGTDRSSVLPIFMVILLSHAVLNHVGVKAVSVLNWLSAWYHLAVVALVIGVLAALAPRQPVEFLFTRFTSTSYPYYYAFLVGLLQAQWTFTGYDASAHVTEETVDPARNAPRGVVMSVVVSAIAGYLMLLVVTLAISASGPTDLAGTAASSNAFIHVVLGALGRSVGVPLVWLVVGAMWFCGLASITSNSRMLYAFARDGGLPAHRLVARISPRYQTPHVAVWISAAAALLVALWAEAYSAMTALSTLALYASYGLPVALGLRARLDGRWRRRGPWDLGRYSTACNLIALGWVAVITVLFMLPPNAIAGYTFAGCLAVLAASWYGGMRSRFAGPRVKLQGD